MNSLSGIYSALLLGMA